MSKNNPWSRPIDYDREIAEDERWIAACEAALANGWWSPECFPGIELAVLAGGHVLGLDWAKHLKFETLGITREDVLGMAMWADWKGDLQALATTGDEEQVPVRLGIAAFKKLSETSILSENLPTHARLQSDLKLHRTRLARHRRNQVKNGRK